MKKISYLSYLRFYFDQKLTLQKISEFPKSLNFHKNEVFDVKMPKRQGSLFS